MRSNGQLTGDSAAVRELRTEIGRIARSDARVLISGEPGVGKQLVAREIHAQSLRASRAFVPARCAGLPETLLESELFGHVKGSFTGAYCDKAGKLEIAHDGTLFLDDVGGMPLRMQGLLLRFLETSEVQKIGCDRVAGRANVRVIAATHRPLLELMGDGCFREDLFYRLNVIHLIVPPLRDRRDDIPALIDVFRRRAAAANSAIVERFSDEAIAALADRAWPGNVRELEDLIERVVLGARSAVIGVNDLPEPGQHPWGSPSPARAAAVTAGAEPSGDATVVDDLYRRLRRDRESFWTAVYPLYMQREITRAHVRDLVQKGLEEARGNYKIMVELFNMDAQDYKKFLNFLRKHQCQLPFKDYRQITHA